ncbi:hypothetical protein GMX10_17190 [Pectobacterium parvum]|uniref:Uncharacterized protein n=1 Tax=Pectobacterium parvum TaxID=2778550 RepID=A0AAP9IIG3_9GAMM|nr:hypothetical protein GMX10_17190 [Pectobacterium parvum]
MYPHTKGAQFFAVGRGNEYRHPEGFPDVWPLKQSIRKPFMEGGRTGEGGTRLVRPWMSCLLASLLGHGEVRTV